MFVFAAVFVFNGEAHHWKQDQQHQKHEFDIFILDFLLTQKQKWK
jgi:hypothetical protein